MVMQRKLNKTEMNYYQGIVDRYLDSMLAKPNVYRFGFGYKIVGGETTDSICLVAFVYNKSGNIRQQDRIPSTLDGVATDVVELVEPPFMPENELPGTIPDRYHTPYSTIMGGMPIRNNNLDINHVGVLGTVVFDKRTDASMGLSAQHAIGTQPKGRGEKKAREGDPIYQPPSLPARDENKIGELSKFDVGYDAALFRIDSPRGCQAKMLGIDETPFDLSEITESRLGQEVECPARRTYTNGKVCWCVFHKAGNKTVRTVIVRFSSGYTSTWSGDSGAVWIDKKSRSPIALHCGTWTVSLKERPEWVAYSTCMQQLSDWGGFRISPPQPNSLASDLAGFETSFVRNGDDVIVFCDKPGTANPLVIAKYNCQLEFIEESDNQIFPMSGVASANFNDSIYAAWRSGNNEQIQVAALKPSGTELETPITLRIRTLRKPAMVQFKNKLYISYIDAATQRLSVVYSADPSSNTSWRRYEISNVKSRAAPAMSLFNNAVYLCWTDLNNRIRIGKNTGSSVSYYTSLDPKMTIQDPAMTVFDGKLCVAYTTLTGELRIVETSDLWNWSIRKSDPEIRHTPPSLFAATNQLICVR